jgi:predicted nuclease of predicted toxin-antitoxin system
VRFLIDNNLSFKIAGLLNEAGHDAAHVRDFVPPTATDEMIMDLARSQARVVISADTDFGALLARQAATTPSVLLVRRLLGRRVTEMGAIILANIDTVVEDLRCGAIVVLTEDSIRIRRLPVLPR